MQDLHGKLILIVDNSISGSMPTELGQLQSDLICDGWQVIRHDVGRGDSVTSVKSLISNDYLADPANVKAVLLFGHVPVPYSGDINPDGHSDHKGAWGADSYYASMNGSWTDNSVNDTSSSARIDNSQANYNTPGDGKFDQSTLPADVTLQVGRVDLHDLPQFAPLTETDLLKNYLNKDHKFRTGQISLNRRAIVDDNFGTFNGEAFAANGFRNFAPMFGASNITSINSADQTANTSQFFGTLSSQSYLWAYGCGPGFFYQCNGVGKTDNFAQQDPQAAFYMAFGSYLGDWDCGSDYLRAPLGAHTAGLTCVWAGRPNWYFHHMALGETIGYSTVVTQNNNGLYPTNRSGRGVHVALMGDPTLRMYPVLPPSNLNAASTGLIANLTWSPSSDSNIAGYHVYRSANSSGPFTRVSSAIVPTLFYDDITPTGATYYYLVRAVKLETSSSGTFYNPSEGIETQVVSSGVGVGSTGILAITSAPAATPNPAKINETVNFSVAASNSNGDALTYIWNYGDGSTGTTASHSYSAAGTYTVVVLIADAQGNRVTGSVVVTVSVMPDLTGILNTIVGNDPTTPTSVPVVTDTTSLQTNKFGAFLNFATFGHDSLQANFTLALPPGFKLAGSSMAIVVGEYSSSKLALNSKGIATGIGLSLKLALPKSSTEGVVQFRIRNQKLGPYLASSGLISETTPKKGQIRTLPVGIALVSSSGETYLFTGATTATYKAIVNKSGKAIK